MYASFAVLLDKVRFIYIYIYFISLYILLHPVKLSIQDFKCPIRGNLLPEKISISDSMKSYYPHSHSSDFQIQQYKRTKCSRNVK